MEILFTPVPAPGNGPVADGHPFGTLEPLIHLLAAARDLTEFPGALAEPRLVTFAATHGCAEAAISANPLADTALRVRALRAGEGRVATTAQECGVSVRVVDLTEPTEDRPALPARRIDDGDALTEEELVAAVQAGRQAADAAADEGCDLLIGASCSVGVSTPVAVITAAMLGLEPVDATTRGSGINDDAWIRKATIVRNALRRVSGHAGDPLALLRMAGGADLAALTGFIAQAAARRTPVLIDDSVNALAAALATLLAPGTPRYLVATSRSDDRLQRRLLGMLELEPLTAWELREGGGTGAMLLVPVIRAALRARAVADPGSPMPDAVPDWNSDLL